MREDCSCWIRNVSPIFLVNSRHLNLPPSVPRLHEAWSFHGWTYMGGSTSTLHIFWYYIRNRLGPTNHWKLVQGRRIAQFLWGIFWSYLSLMWNILTKFHEVLECVDVFLLSQLCHNLCENEEILCSLFSRVSFLSVRLLFSWYNK